MMYVRQIIMMYNFNLYSAVCQLYLNKTGRKQQQQQQSYINQDSMLMVLRN